LFERRGEDQALDEDKIYDLISQTEPELAYQIFLTAEMISCSFYYLQGKRKRTLARYAWMTIFAQTRLPYASSYNNSNIGLQREINLRISQMQEEAARALLGGNKGIKGDPLLVKKLNDSPLKIGEWTDLADNAQIVDMFEDRTAPEAIKGLHDTSIALLERKTAFASLSQGGQDQEGESGYHRELRQQESKTTVLPFIDEFRVQCTMVVKSRFERGIPLLTGGRIMRITGDPVTPETVQTANMLAENLKSVRRFDVLADSPFTTTQELADHVKKMDVIQTIVSLDPQAAAFEIDPGEDIIRGSGIQDEESLAKRFSARHAEIVAGKLGGGLTPTPGGNGRNLPVPQPT
jgi:hypothetical protein